MAFKIKTPKEKKAKEKEDEFISGRRFQVAIDKNAYLREEQPNGIKMKSYPMTPLSKIKTKDEARTMAIDYQSWASEQSMSYGELIVYQNYFERLGKKFGLKKEFKREGIL
jgi:hypothetical protein